ncbi:MAG: polyprenyl synthetase family protein [Rikenellaceae bacterium]
MKSSDFYLDLIEGYISQIELPSEPENLYAPIRYSISGGGKRIRPLLLMLTHSLFDDNYSEALPAAAAIEVFHTFTLLHDDIMDNAPIRRGKASVHAQWGSNVAILSGDVMMINAYKLLSQVQPQYIGQALEVFNNMASEVCEGQQYDMDFETRPKVSVAEYMTMIELKTSVLLGGAAYIGALLGGATIEQCKTLQKIGTVLGLAFQLQDDLLDSYGDEQLGKAIGGDILEGKQTFLMITAMSRADEPTREILRNTHRDESLSNKEKIARIKEVYDKLDIVHLTKQQIKTKFDRALAMLDSLNIDEGKLFTLKEFAQSLINRRK